MLDLYALIDSYIMPHFPMCLASTFSEKQLHLCYIQLVSTLTSTVFKLYESYFFLNQPVISAICIQDKQISFTFYFESLPF